ncbi:sugar transferase [Dechloromonas sp. A34]|uniref:sugar transferase n=1 Tax=Dechloromonas sp. A34 TaxID=447588 RepID=UPI00224988FB|nr:sugar transferase [Dechloromonas sp. A34]
MKRLFDILFALAVLVFASPFFLVGALVVWLDMGRPVFFRQQRPGYLGRPFMLYKFRTMREGYDAAGRALPDAKRLTRWGTLLRRTSIDELPQLINVLKGDMGIVGPRPLLMEYLPLYSAEQMRRHAVLPGITGWAQVNGRNALSWEERFRLDVWYVDHRSFWLDMKILWLTARKVLVSEGISAAGEATMSKFTGSKEQ